MLALFTTSSRGTYIKPTEGILKQAYNTIELPLRGGGFWMWVCNLIRTSKTKTSYIYGAVFVAEIMDTAVFKQRYPAQRRMKEFQHSKRCPYQMIILMHASTRLQLMQPIEVDKYVKGDQRIGVWKMKNTSLMYKSLRNAKFVGQ